jgi:hypothetical protein
MRSAKGSDMSPFRIRTSRRLKSCPTHLTRVVVLLLHPHSYLGVTDHS